MTKRHRNDGLRKVCGCPRRLWAKCAHSWHFNYKVRGGPSYRFSLDVELGRHVAGKTEAAREAAAIRAAILAGTFRRRGIGPHSPGDGGPVTGDRSVLGLGRFTLAQLGDVYFERRGRPANENERAHLRRLAACRLSGSAHALGETPVGAVTTDALEAFFGQLRATGAAPATQNKYRLFVAGLFRWAVKKGYLARNPLADADTIRHVSEKGSRRSRRLEPAMGQPDGSERPSEEARLLDAAGPHLQRLIVAAIETGMRRGELLGLQWRDVDLTRRELRVRAETSKSRRPRLLPISSRLAGVLEMARTDPTGQPFGPEDYVLGDEAGRRVMTPKRSWETCVLKAHGHTPEWLPGGKLSAASRAQLRRINLHFHDLRHEAGSRLLEAGWPIHHVQEMLGHTDLKQTSTYLNVTRLGLHDSMRRFTDEAGSRCNPIANEAPTAPPLLRNGDAPVTGKSLVN